MKRTDCDMLPQHCQITSPAALIYSAACLLATGHSGLFGAVGKIDRKCQIEGIHGGGCVTSLVVASVFYVSGMNKMTNCTRNITNYVETHFCFLFFAPKMDTA